MIAEIDPTVPIDLMCKGDETVPIAVIDPLVATVSVGCPGVLAWPSSGLRDLAVVESQTTAWPKHSLASWNLDLGLNSGIWGTHGRQDHPPTLACSRGLRPAALACSLGTRS